ncbi:hypothetical protein ACLB2K_046086 [Fragaria x ananassa]
MSCFNYSFIWLLFLSSALVASASDKKHHKGPVVTVTKQLTFPDFNLSYNPRILNDVKLLGSAKLASNTTAIQIPDESHVDDLRHQAGRAIYSSSIRLLDPHTETPASFETTFSFQFHNASSSSAERIEMTQSGGYGVGGSGLTFVIVPDEFTVGRPGAWLAMLNDACEDDYKVIAIEFDTRLNPEFGDPNDNHGEKIDGSDMWFTVSHVGSAPSGSITLGVFQTTPELRSHETKSFQHINTKPDAT